MYMYVRILQVMVIRAKFSRIRIRTNLLQRCDNDFGHFSNIYLSIKLSKRVTNFHEKLLFDPTGDSATERLKIPLKILFQFFSQIFH